MSEDRLSRLGPLAGLLFVVLELGGFAIGSAAGRASVTLGDSTAKIVNAFADPAGTGVWVGAYMELLALPAFAVFAAWLFRSRGGLLSTAGLLGAASYLAITTFSLVLGDVLEYRAGHGLGAQTTLALFDLQAGLFVVSWGIAAGMLVVAPASGWLRRAAIGIAALGFIGMAMPKATPGQLSAMLFIVWVLAASTGAALRQRATAGTSPVAGAA
jgi:hypothetical protein